MYIEKTTSAERDLIKSALIGIFPAIDTAHLIIMDELEDHFPDLDQKDINAWEAERIGRRLRAAANMIFDALLQYYLTVAEDTGRGVAPHLEGAARAQAAISTDRAGDKCWEAQHRAGLRTEEAEKIRTAMAQCYELPDEQALPLLEQLAGASRD